MISETLRLVAHLSQAAELEPVTLRSTNYYRVPKSAREKIQRGLPKEVVGLLLIVWSKCSDVRWLLQ